jgi:hypothetical protein
MGNPQVEPFLPCIMWDLLLHYTRMALTRRLDYTLMRHVMMEGTGRSI